MPCPAETACRVSAAARRVPPRCTARCVLPPARCPLQLRAARSRLPAAASTQPTALSCLRVARCALLPARCPLPTAAGALPPALCVLPTLARAVPSRGRGTREPTSPGILPALRHSRLGTGVVVVVGGSALRTEGGGGAPAAGTVSLGRRCVRLASGCCGTAGSRRLRSTICAAPALLAAAPIRRAPPCPPSPGEAAAAPAAPATRTRRPPASLLLLSPPCRGVFSCWQRSFPRRLLRKRLPWAMGRPRRRTSPQVRAAGRPAAGSRRSPGPAAGVPWIQGFVFFFIATAPVARRKTCG